MEPAWWGGFAAGGLTAMILVGIAMLVFGCGP
jgi:fumarate reductase subunit D